MHYEGEPPDAGEYPPQGELQAIYDHLERPYGDEDLDEDCLDDFASFDWDEG